MITPQFHRFRILFGMMMIIVITIIVIATYSHIPVFSSTMTEKDICISTDASLHRLLYHPRIVIVLYNNTSWCIILLFFWGKWRLVCCRINHDDNIVYNHIAWSIVYQRILPLYSFILVMQSLNNSFLQNFTLYFGKKKSKPSVCYWGVDG